jgi:hypothetical protein
MIDEAQMRWNDEFTAYKEELESRSHFTLLSDEDINKYDLMAIPPKVFTMEAAKKHPFTWAYHVIGVKPRDYQFKILDDMYSYGKLAGVTSRQIGKSTSVAIFAFWAAYNNMYPSGPNKNTKIMIVSHTEQAAKELLRTIDDFISLADDRMALYTKDRPAHEKRYFRSRIKTQTQFEIHFPKGTIQVFPPTGKVRGKSIDVLMIDEAAWLTASDPDYFFASDALPTTTATNGKIFLFSTPKGSSGFFHDIIRPNNEEPLVGWKRIWMPWTVVGVQSILENIWSKKDEYIQKGDELDFKIEYEASFLSGKSTFFNPMIIDQCVDISLTEEFTFAEPVTVGLDFGDVHSRTVLTVVSNNKESKVTTLLWQKEFPGGYNNADIADFIYGLQRQGRYIVRQIVVDDCVGGKTAMELLRRKGFNLVPFQFSTSKHEYFEYMKVAFANNRIALYNDPAVIAQLKALESHETVNGNIQIRKPVGGRDDRVDSLMLACSPFIKPERRGEWRFANFSGLRRRK